MWLLLFLPLSSVSAHGNMVAPAAWSDRGGQVGLKPGQSCAAGAEYTFAGDPEKKGLSCMWFTDNTKIKGEATLKPELRTFAKVELGAEEKISRNPWMAPGSAPVFSPCGVAGGNPKGCPEGAPPGRGQDCGPYGGGFSYGPLAQNFDFKDMVTTEWRVGGKEVAGWSTVANHGGGYSYRLCRLGPGGRAELTEECFQRTPLKFASSSSWVQYGEDENSKVFFRANRTTEGTLPEGSEWSKNPIPNCAGVNGGFLDPDSSCPKGLQFPAPAAGLFGHGSNIHTPNVTDFQWTLMDELEVPVHMVPGDYVLSFRWDCEQTAQVWTTCANIRLLPALP